MKRERRRSIIRGRGRGGGNVEGKEAVYNEERGRERGRGREVGGKSVTSEMPCVDVCAH
jgi:hypothetical protein